MFALLDGDLSPPSSDILLACRTIGVFPPALLAPKFFWLLCNYWTSALSKLRSELRSEKRSVFAFPDSSIIWLNDWSRVSRCWLIIACIVSNYFVKEAYKVVIWAALAPAPDSLATVFISVTAWVLKEESLLFVRSVFPALKLSWVPWVALRFSSSSTSSSSLNSSSPFFPCLDAVF